MGTPDAERRPGDIVHPAAADLIEAAPDAMLAVDAGGHFIACNAAARAIFGRDMAGLTLQHWQREHLLQMPRAGGRCPAEELPLVRALRGEVVDESELLVSREGSGAETWLDASAKPLRDASDRIVGAVATYRIASRRKRIEQTLWRQHCRLEERYQRQSALADIALAVNEASELQAVLDRLAASVARLLPADSALIVVREPDGRFAVRAAAAPGASALPSIEQRGGATQWILDHRRPLTVTDRRHDPFAASPLFAELGAQAYAGVPLIADGDAVGVLYAIDERPRARSQDDLDFLAAVAERAASAIVKVRLYERLRALNESLESSTAALRAKEAELQQHHDHLESLVRERTAELQSSHERLMVADRLASIGTLTAGLGHDMNNLLFPLRCRLDALDWPAVPASYSELLRSVAGAVGYLQQLADGLRLFALDPEMADATPGVTDLRAWWDQVSPLLVNAIAGNVSLRAELGGDLPPVAVAPHRLTQAVLNLVLNAGEAMPEGGQVVLSAEHDEAAGRVRVAVSDEGIGMTAEVRSRAFDPFFTTKKRRLSTGLGLSLVHGVVSASHGSIDVDTAPGSGTTVVLNLPAGARLPAAGDRDAPAATVHLANPRTAAWISGLLRTAGYTVARDGGTGECRLWVTDGALLDERTARRFLSADRQRRLIVIGNGDPWRELGAVVVENADELEELRAAVREAIRPAAPGGE